MNSIFNEQFSMNRIFDEQCLMNRNFNEQFSMSRIFDKQTVFEHQDFIGRFLMNSYLCMHMHMYMMNTF
jgi:hypothetical protein